MRITKIVTAAFLVLGLSPLAWGDDRWDRDRDRDRRYRPDRWESERVMGLAHEVESTAASIHRQFERNNRRPDRDEARAAAMLHQLQEEADHFHAQVEGRRQEPGHTRRDFEALLAAFDEAAYSLEAIARRGYVDRGMDRIWVLLSDLDRYYGGSGHGRGYGRHDGWRDRDRYDHDRYDGHGRYDRGHRGRGRHRDQGGRYEPPRS